MTFSRRDGGSKSSKKIPAHARSVVFYMLALILAAAVIAHPSADGQTRAEKIDDLRRKIDEANERQRVELEAVEESDQRLNAVTALIDQLEGEIALLRSRIAEVQAELDVWIGRVKSAESRLRAIESDLEAVRHRMNQRAVTLYKRGNVNVATLVIESDSINQAELNIAYERRIQAQDADLAATLSATAKDAEETRYELDLSRAGVESRRDELAARKAELDASLADQKKLKAALEKEIASHKGLIARLQNDVNQWSRALDELEGASRRIGGFRLSRGSGNGRLVWPADGPLTSPFGMRHHPILGYARMHTGIDIGAPNGSDVVASAPGSVVAAGYSGGYGNMVVIDHGDGLATAYCHLSSISVGSGQSVSIRQTIGRVGSTGLSTGPHLHFETRVNGGPVDPMRYFT